MHFGISVYEKNTLASIFKWLLACKWGLSRPKFIPITHSIIYHFQKAKKIFLWRKSHWGSWSSRRCSLIGFSLGFTVIGSSLGFSLIVFWWDTAQKMKFSITDFSSKCDQIRRKLRIWSHLLKKSIMENFPFCAVSVLSDKVFFKSSVTGSSSKYAVRDSSPESSVLFFHHAVFFVSCYDFLYQKQIFCLTLYSQKEVRT